MASSKKVDKNVEKLRKRDAYALAALIYDIYQDHKRKDKKDGTNIRQTP